MSPFTRASSYYFKVLSPYAGLGEKRVFFSHLIDDTDSSYLCCLKPFETKSLNKELAPNGSLIGLSQLSAPLLNSSRQSQFFNCFLLPLNQKFRERVRTTTIAFSFEIRQKYYQRVRPLLSINRFDVQYLCLVWKLPIYPDKSNKQFIQSRNRIRRQLLPIMRFYFNPQIEAVLFQFTEILNQEDSYLERLSSSFVNPTLLFSFNRSHEDQTLAFFPLMAFDSVTRSGGEKRSTPTMSNKLLQVYDLQTRIQRILKSNISKKSTTINKFCLHESLDDRCQSVECQLKSIPEGYNIDRGYKSICLKEFINSNVFPFSAMPRVLRRRILKFYLEKTTGRASNFFYIEKLLFLLKELAN